MTLQQQLEIGWSHHQAGRLAEAERIYRRILTEKPDYADAMHLLGMLAGQIGQIDAAADLIRKAIRLQPTSAEAHSNLGYVLAAKGLLDEAIASYREAIRLKPDFAGAYNNLGNALKSCGKVDDALASYQEATKLKSDFAEAHNNLGVLLAETGKLEEAVASYREAIRLKPGYAEAQNNLGNALEKLGQSEEAMACYRQAISLKPDLAEAHNNLGFALAGKSQFSEAIIEYRHATRLKPHYAEAHNNLGNVFRNKGQPDEAIACYQQGISLKPDFVEARSNLGNVLAEVGRFRPAIDSYRQALLLKPDYAVAHSNLVFLLHYQPDYDAGMLFDELRLWNDQHAKPLATRILPHANNRDPERRLRIGYVSPDLRDHVVGRNLLPLFREHDHDQVEVFCYTNSFQGDGITQQIKQCSDGWRVIAGRSNAQAVEMVRQDQIDILVDLALHSASNRLLVFAQKPAPVQATFAGYPGSTGLDTIDYRLTDPYLDPPGLNDRFYSETSIRLTNSFWCYDAANTKLDVNPLPAQTRDYFTFACLNNFCKVNEPVLKLWARVLRRVEHSRLIMLCPEGSHRQALLEIFQREGVQPDRIELAASRPRSRYFEIYHRIDLALDTFPYNGHTTSLDSFWMGVPVVTLVGKTVVGRAGLSQSTNLGLPEVVAHTPEQFVEIAAGLAENLPRLAELRRTLRRRMQESPLLDASGFARSIESSYRQMWRHWCNLV
jgi:predicted O-linked N-acetylglucosamine transferase (SPINDLY family)